MLQYLQSLEVRALQVSMAGRQTPALNERVEGGARELEQGGVKEAEEEFIEWECMEMHGCYNVT